MRLNVLKCVHKRRNMEEKIGYRIDGNEVVRTVRIRGMGVKTSRLPIPEWVDRTSPVVDIYDISWLAARERPRVRMSAREIRAVDLFCGCGGLTLGIREAARGLGCGFRSVFASDINSGALALYEKNFQPDHIDARPIEEHLNGELGANCTDREREFVRLVGHVDIVVAGPPCQGNSNLNNYTRRNDPKNLLYLRAVRCVELLRPHTVIIENVPGVKYEKHEVLQKAVAFLSGIGYKVSYSVISMRKLGVAQTRKRMILIASLVTDITLDQIQKGAMLPDRPLSWACGDLLAKYDGKSVFNSSAQHSLVNQQRMHYLFQHNLYNLPNEQRPDCHRLKPHTYPAVYGRMRWDAPAPTITGGFGCCGRGRFVHPLCERTLTPHEAARVQYFPDFFDFGGLKRTALATAIGNAVPARAGYVVALPLLLAALEREADE